MKLQLRGAQDSVFQPEDQPSEFVPPIDAVVVQLVNRRLPLRGTHLVDAVEPFVLPAIEQDKVDSAPPAETGGGAAATSPAA